MDAFFHELEHAGVCVIRDGFEHELSDESRLRGHAEGIVRARNEADIVALVRASAKWRVPVTVAAGRTSFTGAATPLGGIVCDIKALDAVDPADPTRVGPGMVKVGLDFAVPMEHLERLAALYDEAFQGLDAYVFGHIGNAHIHANLLPDNETELQRARTLLKQLAQEVCALGGSVSGEHGIGKLKHELL